MTLTHTFSTSAPPTVKNADELPLSDQQLDRLADLLAMKLAHVQAPAPAAAMLTVEDICANYKVSRAWVYENAGRLGGKKLGPGLRAPIRFEKKCVEEALSPLASVDQPVAPAAELKLRRRPARHLLQVYDG